MARRQKIRTLRGYSAMLRGRGFQTYSRWTLIRLKSHVATDPAESSTSQAAAVDHVTPSGWSPPSGRPAPPGVQPDVPYRVVRSRYGNVPVYLDYRSGGSRILTIIRKIEGDATALEKALRAHLGVKRLLTRVDSLIGTVTISGNHKDRAVAWLKSMGF